MTMFPPDLLNHDVADRVYRNNDIYTLRLWKRHKHVHTESCFAVCVLYDAHMSHYLYS